MANHPAKTLDELLSPNCLYQPMFVRPSKEVEGFAYARGWNIVYDPAGTETCNLSHIGAPAARCRTVSQEARYFHATVRWESGASGTAIVEIYPTQIEAEYLRVHPR